MNKNERKIPDFTNDADEALYWDENDVTAHLDGLEPVEVQVKEPLEHTLTIRISKEDLAQLRELGLRSGTGTTTMARFLIRQSLRPPSAFTGLSEALMDQHDPAKNRDAANRFLASILEANREMQAKIDELLLRTAGRQA